MQTITFAVQGSADTPYQVTFGNDGGSVICTCTCRAGVSGQPCKHRNRIISGSNEDIAGEFIADFSTVQTWLPGSTLVNALATFNAAEAQLEDAKKAVLTAKKALAMAMRT